MPANEDPPSGRRLESWKEISAYLNREVRTARRWEKERGLPVHRFPGKRSCVYAWAAEVDEWLRTGAAQNSSGHNPPEVLPALAQVKLRRPAVRIVLAALLMGGAAILFALSATNPVMPQLRNQAALTNDGLIKDGPLFVGRTLYFVVRDGERWKLMRSPLSGGTPSPVINYSPGGLWPLDLSPDESELLALQGASAGPCCPLWVLPMSGGSARKRLDRGISNAAWSSDGKKLAYASEDDLYVANRDATMPRRLATLPGSAQSLTWSPDGKRLRFIIEESTSVPEGRLWEVDLDRPNARRLLPDWKGAPRDFERPGRWTANAEFFIFAAVHDGVPGLFAIREGRPFYYGVSPTPIRLTTSIDGVAYPTPSPDGKKLFAIVLSHPRGELNRYEPTVGEFVVWPGMPGLSAGHVAFSPDGHEAAYVSYPEMNLWKMNTDGTGSRQLTFGILKAAMPRWSPDGRRIAFMSWDATGNLPTKIRIISAEGGSPQDPVKWPGWQGIPTWTSDGKNLIFGENGQFNPIPASCALHRFNLRTGDTSVLPGTTGLWTARACPTGRYVAATTRDNIKLVLYDMQTARLTDLVSFPDSKVGDNPTWSNDGKFIYIDAPLASDPVIYRICIRNRHMERVASIKGIQRANGGMDHWIGLTPDGSPLITRRIQGAEIYAWDWVAR